MAITQVDKVRINKYLKEHAIGDIYYIDMVDALGKRGKISDIEFVEYFTNYVINELRKEGKISVKQLSKVISTIERFLNWINEENSELSEDVLDKIRNFNDIYAEYLNRTGIEDDTDLVESSLESLLKTVDELYPSSLKHENVAKYINKISELEDNVKDLKKQINNLTRLYGNLQGVYEEKVAKIQSLNDDMISFDRDVKIKTQEIIRLNEKIKLLENKVSELESSLALVEDERNVLAPYKQQYEELLVEANNLKAQIDEYDRIRNKEIDLKVKESELESLIYQRLLIGDASIDEILKSALKEGIVSDRNEIVKLLKKIKRVVNVENKFFVNEPVYNISIPNVLEHGEFSINVPDGCRTYDIMLVSDFHVRNFDTEVLSRLDMLNDYCIKHGIHFILNLGDFFDGIGGKNICYDNACKNYELIEDAIKCIPTAGGLYHAILGGNHDKNIMMYGFDPIKILTDEREDFINLGYTHSTINLNGSYNTLGSFDVHHPNDFCFPIAIDQDGINLNTFNNYLNDFYLKQNRNRDDSCIDIFGHTHKSQFNSMNSYCFIPPFLEKREKSGAWHLRFYLDGNEIQFMQFIQLGVRNGLFRNNEIVYKKMLTK